MSRLDGDDIRYLDGKFGELHEKLNAHISTPCRNSQHAVQEHLIAEHSNGKWAKILGAGLGIAALIAFAALKAWGVI